MPHAVLLIHANAARAALVKDSLHNRIDRAFLVEWVPTCADGILRLGQRNLQRISAILLSLDLPDSEGIKTFDAIFRAAPEIPIFVLTEDGDEDRATLAVERGAHDYMLERDLPGSVLPKAVRNMIERALTAEALFSAAERAEVTLNSIGDAVISTDIFGVVTFLNPTAQVLTGWTSIEAVGKPVDEIMRIIDPTDERRILRPLTTVIRNNTAAKLDPGCRLIRRDGLELAIEDSAAPIHDRAGRVTGAVMVFHDITQAQAISQKMSHLAQHDYLTDLPNRLLLNDRLSQAIVAAQRSQLKLAVLFVDLDRFKHVNDSLGHTVGDELLISVAKRLVACVRSSDTVSRQGGDEFVLLLSAIGDPNDAASSAQKLIAAVGLPHFIAGHNLPITLSAGISIYPDDGVDADTLVRNADTAMRHAKDGGRNDFKFFKASMNERALERQSLESGLRHALTRGEFELHYQAKVDLATELVCGAEALIRWKLPNQDFVSPNDFIPIAEQSGYIVPIGRWVLRQACLQSRGWSDAQLSVPIAVNVSTVELRAKNFVENVRLTLEETGADPAFLEFELTETALMQDPQSTIAALNDIKDLGIRLTLDDFGTGYSSLSYLRRFPIDALKIDKSFVHGLCTNQDDAKIVSAVINLGRSFQLQVIAEGVETRQQLVALQNENCGTGQGFYFQKPAQASEFTKLLDSDLATTLDA